MTTTVVKPAIAQGSEEMKELEKRELEQLQKQNRLNEKTKLQCGDAITQRQKKVITTLSTEKKNLMRNLKLIKSTRTQKLDSGQADKITELFKEMDMLDAELETERNYLNDLNKQILKTTNAIYQAKKTVNYAQERKNAEHSEKNVYNLQNKLYVANVRLNETLKENRKLKEEIDLQIITRNAYNNKYNKMLSNLENGKKIVSEVIERGMETYDRREVVIRKLTGLRDRDRVDLTKRSAEMKDLQMRYEHDVKVRDFMQVASQKRMMQENERRMIMKKEEEKEKNLALEVEYASIYTNIVEYSETDEMNDIKKNFSKQEAENMMLLNYANESNDELEALSEQIQEQMNRYLDLKADTAENIYLQEEEMHDLEDKLSQLRSIVQTYDKENKANENMLSTLYTGIQQLFALSNCEKWPIEQLLGDNARVTIFNFMLYFKLIEEKVIDTLNTFNLPKVNECFTDFFSKQSSELQEFAFSSKYDVSQKLYASDICAICLGNTIKSFRVISFDMGNTH